MPIQLLRSQWLVFHIIIFSCWWHCTSVRRCLPCCEDIKLDPEAEWPGHAVRLRSGKPETQQCQRVLSQALACLVHAGSPKPQSSLLLSHPASASAWRMQSFTSRLTHWCCGGTGLPLACHLPWLWPQSSFRWVKTRLIKASQDAEDSPTEDNPADERQPEPLPIPVYAVYAVPLAWISWKQCVPGLRIWYWA